MLLDPLDKLCVCVHTFVCACMRECVWITQSVRNINNTSEIHLTLTQHWVSLPFIQSLSECVWNVNWTDVFYHLTFCVFLLINPIASFNPPSYPTSIPTFFPSCSFFYCDLSPFGIPTVSSDITSCVSLISPSIIFLLHSSRLYFILLHSFLSEFPPLPPIGL